MEKTSNLKTVAIVGRPNVGKSTLYNRLTGRREAIETSVPGTTRDRLFGEVSWQGKEFILLDLAGIEFGGKSEMEKNIQEGVDLAIETADLILFLVDYREKDNQTDKNVARKLRKIDKKVIMVINKADDVKKMQDIDQFKRLGNFQMIPVSAISGKNTGDLLDLICRELGQEKTKEERKKEKMVNLAIIGRPNVGKSTLVNTIVGEKRAVVSEIAGTTRDVINVEFMHKGEKINLLDTAGLRRRGKIGRDTIESFASLRTQRALRECEVAAVLIDAEEGIVANDVHILGQAKEWGKGIILAVNKIDVWSEKREEKMARIISELQIKLNFVPYLPVVFISAKEGDNVKALLDRVVAVDKNRSTILPQEHLDQILDHAKESNNQLINMKKLTQKKARPLIFEVSYSGKKAPHYTSLRYLENKIRDSYPLEGAPLFIDLVERKR